MRLIVFAGLPGTGKSSLAETIARRMAIPVFAKDRVEAALVNAGISDVGEGLEQLGRVGYDLLTSLADGQLRLGQPAILDSVASTTTIRDAWRALAHAHGAEWRVIECVCADENLHRTRLAVRKRGIPGWHELDWAEVERVRGYYQPWTEDRLVVDAGDQLGVNLERVSAYLAA